MVGTIAAALHVPVSDGILKDTFANDAFEHHEIAAYASLIAIARIVGDAASVPPLQRSLGEEQAMASFLETHLVPTIDRSLSLTGDGATAGT